MHSRRWSLPAWWLALALSNPTLAAAQEGLEQEGPEVRWEHGRPAFIERVYFAQAPEAPPQASAATPRPDLGGWYTWLGKPLWLVVETGAVAERSVPEQILEHLLGTRADQLCVRWPDPLQHAPEPQCQAIPEDGGRIAFASPDTGEWPEQRYEVELFSRAHAADGDAGEPRPVATVHYALGAKQRNGETGSPPPPASPSPPPPMAAIELSIPQFPWPPPEPTGRAVLDRDRCAAGAATWGAVAQRLETALGQAGYFEHSYYAVPGGFALVTRLEQIEFDGTPKPPPQRWSADAPRHEVFSLRDYLRALFTAPQGHYRVIVFIVNDRAFASSGEEVSGEEALAWLQTGLNRLPPELAAREFTANHACTALVYQFIRIAEDEAVANPPGAAPVRTQLQRSGIWAGLQP